MRVDREQIRRLGAAGFTESEMNEILTALLDELDRWMEWSHGQYPDDSPGDVISAWKDGSVTLDDGITTWNPLRALTFVAEELDRAKSANADAMAIIATLAIYGQNANIDMLIKKARELNEAKR